MGINVKKGGFSIVEIMVSLLLVSIALITIVAVFPKIAGHKKSIREIDQANAIALESLHKLQKQSETTPFNSTTNGLFTPVVKSESHVTFNVGYNVTIDGYLKTAEINVTWTKSDKTHTVKLAGAVK